MQKATQSQDIGVVPRLPFGHSLALHLGVMALTGFS